MILKIIWWDLSDKTLWIPSRFIITPTCWQAQTCRKSIKWKLWKMWREKKTRFMLVLDELWLSQTENSIFQELLRQFERYLYKRRSGGSMGFNGMRGRWELFPLQIFLKGKYQNIFEGKYYYISFHNIQLWLLFCINQVSRRQAALLSLLQFQCLIGWRDRSFSYRVIYECLLMEKKLF